MEPKYEPLFIRRLVLKFSACRPELTRRGALRSQFLCSLNSINSCSFKPKAILLNSGHSPMQFYTKIIAESGVLSILANNLVSVGLDDPQS